MATRAPPPPRAGPRRPVANVPLPACRFRLAAASLAVGGGAIVFCVTVLKYCHILSEAVRGLQ